MLNPPVRPRVLLIAAAIYAIIGLITKWLAGFTTGFPHFVCIIAHLVMFMAAALYVVLAILRTALEFDKRSQTK